jgi:hypothetical protein
MSNNLADSDAAPVNQHLIRPRQVSPLPIGPGGNNPVKQQMNQTNTQLTMLNAQAAANTKYDPPVPKPITKAVTKEGFTDSLYVPTMLYIVGSLLIAYGIVAK